MNAKCLDKQDFGRIIRVLYRQFGPLIESPILGGRSMHSPLRVWIYMLCLLALASLAEMSHAQNVTTWHNDNNRTGWQPNETILTQANVGQANSFGLLWQWPVTGRVFAQPLAVANVQTNYTGCQPCDLVFIATEENWLYAFNAAPGAQSPNPLVWSLNLGTPVTCTSQPNFPPCSRGLLGPYAGVTGTPVIDTSNNTLYVAAAVQSSSVVYELFAVNIASGLQQGTAVTIGGTVNGKPPANGQKCVATNPRSRRDREF